MKLDDEQRLLCECDSWDCRLTIVGDLEELARAHHAGLVLISNRCVHGPEFADRLVESREGYSVYRES